jgi:membrane-associated phospholipid phosphatase
MIADAIYRRTTNMDGYFNSQIIYVEPIVKKRKKVLTVTIIYSIIASMCRVWQGGHWLSDVTFSAIITLWTIFLVKKFYLDRNSST